MSPTEPHLTPPRAPAASKSARRDARESVGAEGPGESATRACNACRRMKIRCVDKENPPLVQDRDPRSRIDSLESEMTRVHGKLDGIAALLRDLVPLAQSNSRPRTTAESAAPAVVSEGPAMDTETGMRTQGPGAETIRTNTADADVSPASLEGFVRWMSAPDAGSTHDAAAALSSLTAVREAGPLSGSGPTQVHGPDDPTYPQEPLPSHSHSHSSSDRDPSDDDDPLDAAVRMESLRSLTQREEAARLRQEGHAESHGRSPRSRSNQHAHADPGTASSSGRSARKRARGEGDTCGEGTPAGDRDRLVRRKGDLSRSFLDPVQLGICTGVQGRKLFDSFFEHSHPFMPVLDPEHDTWEDLRTRSAFCTTVVLLIASQVADGASPSDRTVQLRQAAESMAKVTLFSPVSHFETVQAMVLLACWSDVVWRPACHAMTLAVDMDMHRCLPTLHKTGMGAGKAADELERDRPLVIGARIWLALTKLSYEVAYNHGRPVAFLGENIMQLGRGLLKHPLSLLSDSRLVVSVELQACRLCLFRPFDLTPAHERPDVQEQVKTVNATILRLYEFWLRYYDEARLPRDHFLVQELGSQRAYAQLRTSSLTLHGIKDRRDVQLLSDDKRENLRIVMQSCEFLVSSIGSGLQARNAEYGNHYFHVAIVSTARFLIRLVGLMPGECDTERVATDVENLIRSLPKFPGYSFLSLLRNDLNKARRDGLLPPSSRPSPIADSSQSQSHPQVGLGLGGRGVLPHHSSASAGGADQPIWPWSNSPSSGVGALNGGPEAATSDPALPLPFNLNPDQNFAMASMSAGFPWLNEMDFSQSFAPLLALPPVGTGSGSVSNDWLLPLSFDMQDLLSGAANNA